MTDEQRDTKIKRLTMRSMRRGIKEMDLILQAFASARLEGMTDDELVLYDRLLSENDQDLYRWVTRQEAEPQDYAALMADIRAGAEGVVRPDR